MKKKSKKTYKTCPVCAREGHYIILNSAGQCWKCNPALNRRRHTYVPSKDIQS